MTWQNLARGCNGVCVRRVLWPLLLWLPALAARAPDAPVVLGANESPPYWSQHLPGGGLGGEILRALSRAGGVRTTLVFKPLQRLIEDDTNNDLGNPVFYLPHQGFAAIIPIAVTRAALFHYRPRRPTLPDIGKVEDLGGLRIGVLKGTLMDQALFRNKGVVFEQSHSRTSLFRKLHLGRLDLVVELDLIGATTIQELFPRERDAFGTLDLERSAAPIAIMLAEQQPGAAAVAARCREGLARIIEDGTYQAILERYYGVGRVPRDWRRILRRFTRLYDFGAAP